MWLDFDLAWEAQPSLPAEYFLREALLLQQADTV